ncbi:response regulator transcription factor [uncultured Pseudodesulfovibrio sp.]|uniref:response regulator transcription factor n=1 Tax=uncultured Pseudodesulfovibrio sp. TaxID=2035858 RepID=UPI0029C92F06|nr:response regulator transcription factor [uncultured Pseudodesulfovibrio sp.]
MAPTPVQEMRIFLVDDHPSILSALQTVFMGNGHDICGTATDLETAVRRIATCEPDLVVVDLSLSGRSGLDLIAPLVERDIQVLIYSMHENAASLKRALHAGAAAYVAKREPLPVLLEAIQHISEGKRYVSPLVASNIESSSLTHAIQALSEREQQILDLLANGETNAEIAERLDISIRTVESYYTRMISKLDLQGMKDLRKYAITEGR